mgnify:CR=1 FL=1|jgi:hypothetical protein
MERLRDGLRNNVSLLMIFINGLNELLELFLRYGVRTNYQRSNRSSYFLPAI